MYFIKLDELLIQVERLHSSLSRDCEKGICISCEKYWAEYNRLWREASEFIQESTLKPIRSVPLQEKGFRSNPSPAEHAKLLETADAAQELLKELQRARGKSKTGGKNNNPEMVRPDIDWAIITPLSVEYLAIKRRMKYKQYPRRSYPVTFGSIGPYDAIICKPRAKGQYIASEFTRQVVQEWNPQWVLLAGVAAGISKSSVSLGDIVIASNIYACEYGKVENNRFTRRSEYDVKVDKNWKNHVEVYIDNKERWWEQVRENRPDRKIGTVPRVFLGDVASVDKVIDDPSYDFFVQATEKLPNLLAIEMEGSGVGNAVESLQTDYKVSFFMIRGISDIPKPRSHSTGGSGGTIQRDTWKPYASDAVGAFIKNFFNAPGLPAPKMPRK